jgi:hypothetical protein
MTFFYCPGVIEIDILHRLFTPNEGSLVNSTVQDCTVPAASWANELPTRKISGFPFCRLHHHIGESRRTSIIAARNGTQIEYTGTPTVVQLSRGYETMSTFVQIEDEKQ